MGLLYVMPASEEEVDRIEKNQDQITLKSYGLPLVFWGYFLAILTTVSLLFLAAYNPIIKIMSGEDQINKLIALCVILIFILTPTFLLIFFFYEKRISKKQNQLILSHYVFGLRLLRKTYHMASNESFEISNYLDSPNMARIRLDEAKMKANHEMQNEDDKKPTPTQLRGFQNNGYFQLYGIAQNGKKVLIDRHSRKADLTKIQALLSKF